MNDTEMGWLMIVWFVFVMIGWLVGSARGQEWSGVFWAMFLGPIGVLVVLALPNEVKLKVDAAVMALRAEELRVQKEILAELRRQKPAPPIIAPPMPAPRVEPEAPGEFVPENLRRIK